VRSVLGQYGQSGAIYEEGLQRLYAEAARNNPDAVWRDLRAHGIVSPAEFQYALQVQDLTAASSSTTVPDALLAYSAISTMPLDECDLMEDETDVEEVARTDRHGKSSHEKVELVPNTQTPLWIKDGEFGTYLVLLACPAITAKQSECLTMFHSLFQVFIDEQSCIGCMQVRTWLTPSSTSNPSNVRRSSTPSAHWPLRDRSRCCRTVAGPERFNNVDARRISRRPSIPVPSIACIT
jgi:hypothetical protein